MKTFRLILILAVPGMGGCATFNPVSARLSRTMR
jgi:hypothetical protein